MPPHCWRVAGKFTGQGLRRGKVARGASREEGTRGFHGRTQFSQVNSGCCDKQTTHRWPATQIVCVLLLFRTTRGIFVRKDAFHLCNWRTLFGSVVGDLPLSTGWRSRVSTPRKSAGYVTNFSPHKALKCKYVRKVDFESRGVLHRAALWPARLVKGAWEPLRV